MGGKHYLNIYEPQIDHQGSSYCFNKSQITFSVPDSSHLLPLPPNCMRTDSEAQQVEMKVGFRMTISA